MIDWTSILGLMGGKKQQVGAMPQVQQKNGMADFSEYLKGGTPTGAPPAQKTPWLNREGMGGLSKGELLMAGMGMLSGKNMQQGFSNAGPILYGGMERKRADQEKQQKSAALTKAMGMMQSGDAPGAKMALAGLYPDAVGGAMAEQAFAQPAVEEPYTLAPGARRFGPDGQEIAANPVAEKPEGPLSTMGKLAADLNAGRITLEQYQMEVGRLQKSDPSLSIQFGEGGALSGLTYGDAPKGKDAAIVRDANGNPVTSPGTQQALYNKAYSANNDWETNTKIVEDDIDRAIKLIDGGMAAGPMAATAGLPIIGGTTPAGQLENLITTISANVGFDKLDEMRRNSPTGGALGNVTEKEIAFLQAVKGSLAQDQSDANLKYNLNRLKTFYAEQRIARREALQRDYPDLSTTAQFRAETNQKVNEWNDADEARLRELEAKMGAQ